MGTGSIADASAFKAAAAEGQVTVNPEQAEAVLHKVRAGKDSVQKLLGSAGPLAEAPKLGANPVGQAISAKVSQRAGGSSDSYTQALNNLYTQYDQAEQAIVAAMEHYKQTDDNAADVFAGQA